MTTTNAITTLKAYAQDPRIFDRYLQIVGHQRTAQIYISECLLAVANSKELQACTPTSIVTSSLRAVTMGLHLDLDEAYLVPFKDQCTLVTGYKGMRNMAIRTNKYRILHAGPIKAGWTVQFHPITGQAEHVQEAGAPAGVVAHFEMFGGFNKTVYMSTPEIHAHAAQYSRSYDWKSSPWKASERSRQIMETKTVFRHLMLEWGYMDPIARAMIETEEAQTVDPTLPEPPTVTEPEAPRKTTAQALAELTA